MPKTEVTGTQIKDASVSLTADVTGILPVANGGSGSNTITLNNVVLGNGTGAVQTVAPSTSGNVLRSDGTTWASAKVSVADLSGNTTTALGVGSVELGHASDTTLSRASAGRLAVEGVNVVTTSSTDTLTNKTLTSPKISAIVDSNGSTNVYFGTGQALDVYGVGNNHAAHFQTNDTTGGSHAAWFQRIGSTGSLIGLYYSGSTTLVGNITTNGSTTTYGTSSDYRLKENVEPLDSGIDTITALNPVKYEWKLSGLYGEGFIAHELQEVIPEAVNGEKDAVEADGTISPQNIDMSKIVPHLVAAVQELKAELDAAKARISALEAAML